MPLQIRLLLTDGRDASVAIEVEVFQEEQTYRKEVSEYERGQIDAEIDGGHVK